MRSLQEAPRWPPPGLERIQGDLFRVAGRAGLAFGILVLPLLFLVTRDQGFASLGPLADAWWISIALGTVGLAFTLDTIIRLARGLLRAGRALQRGYDFTTVLQVLVDAKRDMGFLRSGVRHFSVMEPEERGSVVRMRLGSAMLLAGAGVWALFSLSVGLFLASRGSLAPLGLQLFVLGPALAAYVVGGIVYLMEDRRVRRARRSWYAESWVQDLAREEIRTWQRSVAPPAEADPSEPDGGGTARARTLLAGAGVVIALGALVIVPVMTLVPTSAVGPILSTVSTPGFEAYRPRAARAEAYRSFAIQGDPSISPQEAGQILHDLTFVGLEGEVAPGTRPPSRRYTEPWIPDTDEVGTPLGLAPVLWGDSLISRAAAGWTEEERDYLEEVASHPAFDDFGRLASATAVDVGSARWTTPFPSSMTMATLPIPTFSRLRNGAYARIAAAALATEEADYLQAERLLAEVIAVGFLLGDQGPTLIDNLVGYTMVEAGGAALGDLFRVSSRLAAAAELSRLRQVAERSAAMMRVEVAGGTEARIQALPDLILDDDIVRGLRWEYFIHLTTMAPCLNLHRMVFGADSAYTAFIGEARERLVQWPSEEPLFDLARAGWVGPSDRESGGILAGLAGLYMSTGENSCARMIRHIETASSF